MNDTDDLKELVQKAAAGDKTAFEELYQETCRSVYFTCFGFLKDEQEAQDVTQEVYLTALEQLGTLEDAGKFKPWLYRIAANKSINCLKKKQPSLPGDEQLQDMETEDNEYFLPEEYALNADKREMVLKIVRETCSDTLYQTILLHYFNEFSIAEIAEIMECSEGTVKYRLSVARAKIKEGVLRYEKKSGDKLYSVAVIPFLTAMFTAQMQDMRMPSFSLSPKGARSKSTLAAQTAKTGGRIMLKGLQLKIAVGIAVVVLGGGVAAAVVVTNQKAQEASVGAQEEGTLDVADVGNAEDMDTSPEADDGETEPDEDTLQAETENVTESEATEDSEPTEDTENGEKEVTEETEPTEETTTAEEILEPTAEPEQQYTYTDMSATMYASQTVNVRTLPSTDGEKVGSLSTNQEVNVTGQCNETGWYRFEYNGGTAYVSNNYLSDSKVEVSSQSASSGGSSIVRVEEYPTGQWIDMGDWFFYAHPSAYETTGYNWNDPFWTDIEAILHERYPNKQTIAGTGVYLRDWNISVWFASVYDGVSADGTHGVGYPQNYVDTMDYYSRISKLPSWP